MREDCLVELSFNRMKVHILDEEHGALPDRRHRLMRRVRLIDAKAYKPRIGDEPGGKKCLVGRVISEIGALLLIGTDGGGIAQPFLDVGGGSHGGSRSQEGR